MATGEEIKTLIDDFASDLSLAVPDPAGWDLWLAYLLESLEKEAANAGQPFERGPNTGSSMKIGYKP